MRLEALSRNHLMPLVTDAGGAGDAAADRGLRPPGPAAGARRAGAACVVLCAGRHEAQRGHREAGRRGFQAAGDDTRHVLPAARRGDGSCSASMRCRATSSSSAGSTATASPARPTDSSTSRSKSASRTWCPPMATRSGSTCVSRLPPTSGSSRSATANSSPSSTSPSPWIRRWRNATCPSPSFRSPGSA